MKVEIKGQDIYRGNLKVGSIRANMVFFKGQPMRAFKSLYEAKAWALQTFKYQLRIERYL